MSDLDFLEQEEGLGSSALSTLQVKLTALKKVRKDLASAEDTVELIKKVERKMSREEIPNFLQQYGIDKVSLADGTEVSIKEDISVALPKEDAVKRKAVLSFIIKQGGGGLIKDNLEIEDPSIAIMEQLDKEGMAYKRTQDVNTSSLKAFMRGLLGLKKNTVATVDVIDVPKELNLYVYKETKIK